MKPEINPITLRESPRKNNSSLEEKAIIELDPNLLEKLDKLGVAYNLKQGMGLSVAYTPIKVLPEKQKEILRVFEYGGFTWFGHKNTLPTKEGLGYLEKETIYIKNFHAHPCGKKVIQITEREEDKNESISLEKYYQNKGITKNKLEEISNYFDAKK